MTDIEGFVYLALGDPMQKRNYYRAGWIRFHPDADMSKVISTLGERKVLSPLNLRFAGLLMSSFVD